ncbi:3-oxoacyl-ACP reductase FabG [Streptomyces sp. RS2]|uniref:3-oxoacyl-ACP reductase FabG n=1 Tax=Streptomyces sp. RS2 TaxID=1451205 RepID=UPI0021F831DB|nr:3-oxoacyl-ACP reductase FabG [Streptomyces sp. RS2]MCW1100205.1 3-oxoacyl-ACP reductase FabG [Streptomyces sp. RS2]
MNSKVAIVTGAGRGLGSAIATRLAQDGLAVAVVDLDAEAARNTADSIVAAGGRAVAVTADISDSDQVEQAVQTVEAELGRPTVLVNNAGITRDNLIFKMTESEWDAVMSVHLKGSFLMTKAVQRYMVSAGFGRIINLSSTSALGNRGQVNYSAAKAGLQGFTKTLAIELGKFGITANTVAPGFIATDMNKAVAARLGIPWDQYVTTWAEKIPVGRAGVPDDVANTVSFLAADNSGFVSGQVIYVAGGPAD